MSTGTGQTSVVDLIATQIQGLHDGLFGKDGIAERLTRLEEKFKAHMRNLALAGTVIGFGAGVVAPHVLDRVWPHPGTAGTSSHLADRR